MPRIPETFDEDVDVGPLAPASIRLLGRGALMQVQRFADELADQGEPVDTQNVRELLRLVADEIDL